MARSADKLAPLARTPWRAVWAACAFAEREGAQKKGGGVWVVRDLGWGERSDPVVRKWRHE